LTWNCCLKLPIDSPKGREYPLGLRILQDDETICVRKGYVPRIPRDGIV